MQRVLSFLSVKKWMFYTIPNRYNKRIMQKLIYSFLLIIILQACNSVPRIAVSDSSMHTAEGLTVKGRNGFFIKQKLSFGEYKTIAVNRSWTKGSSWGFSVPVPNDWVERLNIDFVRRKQTVRFSLVDDAGHRSEVTAFSKVRWHDLSIGNNPNSIVNIIGDIMQIGDGGVNTYAVRIIPSKNAEPWEMLIDNNAAQRNAKTYTGLLAKSKTEYYVVAPVYQLINKQGKAVNLPFGGSVGFEFRNEQGQTVAAVSLMEKGTVYFGTVSKEEKFLLANAAAALLLQQNLNEGS